MNDKYDLLHHFLAALAYRTHLALHDAPADFGTFSAGGDTRRPTELVRHMTSLLGYAYTRFGGGPYRTETLPTLDEEAKRFYALLWQLADDLEQNASLLDTTPEQLLQGPFADAMTHTGQLVLLRRLAGSPVPPENFIKADMSPSTVRRSTRSTG